MCVSVPVRSSDLSVLGADEKNAKLKILIRAKIEEYLARAETLKTHVKDKQPKKVVSASGPSATANGDKK
jgi:vacuolar protein-sorting-associated protein 4